MYRIKSAKDLAGHIEYNNLNNLATEEEMKAFLETAKEFDFYGITINPSFVELAKETLKDTDMSIGTVISFPLGFDTIEAKIKEAETAVESGADEIGMVVNISQIKDGNYAAVEEEVSKVKEAIGDKILKAIIESKALDDEEVIKAAQAIEKGGADYIETGTGFVSPNTIYEDVNLINIIQKYAPKIKIKITGGVNIYKIANQLLTGGADLIGSNEGYKIVKDYQDLRENTKITPKPIKFD
ncbi:MAG: deoxyribose-phosphate aldolase [Methanobrevibacter sp.]|uniref:deoxyribose-phosphate aldolase n=1 Tax=Methanobrevibacter sp. TaxID=66852 RepID=UPI0026E0FB53|nr:deoxyribose-phosphate aldolase [Methanobrevibacter sp.]MDO5848302.1 deoxyribose-phosphate aldolase [Methanobrevibacter sp.]